MNVRRWLFSLGALVALTGLAHACSNVYGIPAECRMRVVAIVAHPGRLADAEEVASVRVDGNWAYAACSPSPDGQVNVVFQKDELEVHHQGRRRRLRRDARLVTGTHSVVWDGSGRRFAFFAPRVGEGAAAQVAVVDVRSMADDPPYTIVYTAGEGRLPVGLAWAADQDAVLVLERGALVRADVATVRQRDLVSCAEGERPLDFVVASHEPAPGSRRVLLGRESALEVLDVVTGERRALPLPTLGLHNAELSSDGTFAVLFYRRPAPGPDGRLFRGVYLVDIAGALEGREGALEQLHDATDVHTLWTTRDGGQILWATPAAVFTRRTRASGEPPRALREAGTELEGDVKGAAFDRSGRRIAYTIDRWLHIVDLETGRFTYRAQLAGRFAGHPWWSGDRLVVTVFQNVADGSPSSLLAGEPTNGPSDPSGAASTVSDTPAAPPVKPPAIEASVMVIQRDSSPHVVTLTAGSDDGVVPGAVFVVTRGAQRVGRVVVRQVDLGSSTCEVLETTEGEAIQLGDAATSE